MEDKIFESWLNRQFVEGMALAAESDIVELLPAGGDPPQRYIVRLHCRGLVRSRDGSIREAGLFALGICFPSDYLRVADPRMVLTWFGPPEVWHPNISDRFPMICIGKLDPGTSLKELLHRTYEVVSYQNYTPNEFDSLNRAACAFARENQGRFPIDARPLKTLTKSNPSLCEVESQ
jgi:hypothetical protein